MPAPIVILCDATVPSYGTIAALYRETFRAMGRPVSLLPYPAQPPQVSPGSVVIHCGFAFRLVPVAGARNVAVPFHEWSRYPSEWAACLNRCDEVWAASRYLAEVLRTSGVRAPIRVAPPALTLQPPQPKRRWVAGSPFRFLFVGEPHFRKGHHLLIEGFRRLAASPARATLTIKTSADCAWGVRDDGIRVIAARWAAARMRRLYAQFDAFVSASLGEGLGLGVAEAMLAGLPVATNHWGGHTALTVPRGYVRIPHRVVPQPFCSRPEFYAPGQSCALSAPDDIAAAMDRLLTLTAGERRTMARTASAAVQRHLGLPACARRLRALLRSADEEIAELQEATDAA